MKRLSCKHEDEGVDLRIHIKAKQACCALAAYNPGACEAEMGTPGQAG